MKEPAAKKRLLEAIQRMERSTKNLIGGIGVAFVLIFISASPFFRGFVCGCLCITIVEYLAIRRSITSHTLQARKPIELNKIAFDDYNAFDCWTQDSDKITANGCIVSSRPLRPDELEGRFKKRLELQKHVLTMISTKIIIHQSVAAEDLIDCVVSLPFYTTEREKWNANLPIKITHRDSPEVVLFGEGNEVYIYFPTRSYKEYWYWSLIQATHGDDSDSFGIYTSYIREMQLIIESVAFERATENTESSRLSFSSTLKAAVNITAGTGETNEKGCYHLPKSTSTPGALNSKSARLSDSHVAAAKGSLKPSGAKKSTSRSSITSMERVMVNPKTEDVNSSDSFLIWTNYLISRTWWTMTNSTKWLDAQRLNIQNALNQTTGSIHGPVKISDFRIGRYPPILSNVRDIEWSASGLKLIADIDYNGGFQLTYDCEFFARALAGESDEEETATSHENELHHIDEHGDGQFEDTLEEGFEDFLFNPLDAISNLGKFKVKVRIRIRRIKGTVVVIIPNPPSQKLWYAFLELPDMALEIVPDAQEHFILLDTISNSVEEKIRLFVEKNLIYPQMEDFTLPFLISENLEERAAHSRNAKARLISSTSVPSLPSKVGAASSTPKFSIKGSFRKTLRNDNVKQKGSISPQVRQNQMLDANSPIRRSRSELSITEEDRNSVLTKAGKHIGDFFDTLGEIW